MKDECHGHVMREFVGLNPKMYSFTYKRKLMRDDREIHVREEKKRAKGVSRVVVQSNIHRACCIESLEWSLWSRSDRSTINCLL